MIKKKEVEEEETEQNDERKRMKDQWHVRRAQKKRKWIGNILLQLIVIFICFFQRGLKEKQNPSVDNKGETNASIDYLGVFLGIFEDPCWYSFMFAIIC